MFCQGGIDKVRNHHIPELADFTVCWSMIWRLKGIETRIVQKTSLHACLQQHNISTVFGMATVQNSTPSITTLLPNYLHGRRTYYVIDELSQHLGESIKGLPHLGALLPSLVGATHILYPYVIHS